MGEVIDYPLEPRIDPRSHEKRADFPTLTIGLELLSDQTLEYG